MSGSLENYKYHRKNTKSFKFIKQEEEISPSRGTFIKYLNMDSVIKSIGLLASFSLVLAYLYEYGFLEAIGLNFYNISMSSNDLYRQLFVCLPAIISAYAAFLINSISHILKARESNLTLELTERQMRKRIFCIIICLVCNIIFCWAFGRDYLNFTIFLTYVFLVYTVLYKLDFVKNVFGHSRFLVFIIFPYIIYSTYVMGGDHSMARLRSVNEDILITSDGSVKLVSVLDSYQNGLLYSQMRKVYFVKWESVKSINFRAKIEQKWGICVFAKDVSYVGKMCREAGQPST